MPSLPITCRIGAAFLAMSLLAAPALARGHHGSHSAHHSYRAHHAQHMHHAFHRHAPYRPIHAGASTSPGIPANESALLEHGHYRNRDGLSVHAPAHSLTGAAPDGASARCGDGTYSFSLHRRGTCSHHGGVSRWL